MMGSIIIPALCIKHGQVLKTMESKVTHPSALIALNPTFWLVDELRPWMEFDYGSSEQSKRRSSSHTGQLVLALGVKRK
jgi:hypothetical protein